MKKQFVQLLCTFAVFSLQLNSSAAQSSSDIFRRIKKLEETTTVLYIAAHPDDENTRLIAWMSNEKLFRTAYLSLTRGDGGQNLIGSELGLNLGLIRTRELMSARSIDGGEQFFSSAYDFGYSKTSEETIEIWNKDKILEDMVYVIRKIKPDVMICRFPPDKRAGHGHHSSSAILAREAFDLAADPMKFPEQVKTMGTWKVKRLYWNTFRFGSNNTTDENQLKVDVGGFNPITGKSYGELAAESRSQHKSQGFGVPSQRGTQIEYFSPVAGDTLVADIFQNNENYWKTQNGGEEIVKNFHLIQDAFDFKKPSKSIAALLKVRNLILLFPENHIKKQKLDELDQIILDCTGLWKAAYSYSGNYAIRDTLHVNLQLIVRGYDSLSVTLSGDRFNDSTTTFTLLNQTMLNKALIIKGSSTTTQPYWLQERHGKGNFVGFNKSYTGLPWNPDPIVIKAELNLQGTKIPFDIPVTYKITDPVKGEAIQPLVISPLLTGHLSENTSIFNTLENRKYKLKLHYTGERADSIRLSSDAMICKGWMISFKDTSLYFTAKGEEKEIDFYIRPEKINVAKGTLTFHFSIAGSAPELLQSQKEISYNHLPPIVWFPELKADVQYANVNCNAKKVLYIKGAGDDVAAMLRQIGLECHEVTAADISDMNLEVYDAIVTGIRAYNTDEKLPSVFDKLMNYVKNGGTFVVQYNTNSNLHPASFITPFPYSISRNRVTEEEATVSFTNESNPLLNIPNKITTKDFEGWVQERGLYFATKIDSAFTNVLLMNDQGESPQEGSLIEARYGKGLYIYTGLSFFRQLPAGVPGAFRLFANLISQSAQKREKGN